MADQARTAASARGLDFYRRWAEGMGGDEEQAMLVLVEIAEAARDYFGQSLPYSGDPDADLAQENLRVALRRVTDPRYA